MKINVGRCTYNCEVVGPEKAPAVVLSHSLATDLRMWQPQIDALGELYRLVLFDSLGHGGTDAPSGPYTLDGMARDVVGLLDALAIARAHFVGLSMGGMIGQILALNAPGRLLSLALCDTTSRVSPEAGPAWDERISIALSRGMEPLVEPTIARWFTPPFRERHPETVQKIAAMIRATSPIGYAGCCHAVAALNLTGRIKAIRVPTLVLVGADDPGTPVAASEAIHAEIAGSRLDVIPSAAHLSNIEQAETFTRLLARHLAEAA
jgi:3-oxoadipate enol-lactonase